MKRLIILLFLLYSCSFAGDLSNERVVANYIYNFANLTSYPEDSSDLEFNIYILSSNKNLSKTFQALLNKKKLHSKNIRIKSSDSTTIPYTTNLVFIDKSHLKDYRQIFLQLEGRPVLMVSQNYDNKRLVMINLTKTEGDKLHFEINKANILNQRLKIDPKIILLGGTELDVAKLYKGANTSLINKENELYKKSLELKTQIQKAKKLKTEINNSNKINNKLQKNIKEKNKQLSFTKEKLSQVDKKIKNLQKDISKTEEQLKKQQSILKKEKDSTKKIRQDYAQANLNLDKLTSKLSTQKEEFKSKESKLTSLTQKVAIKVKEFENLQQNLKTKNIHIQEQEKTIDTQEEFLLYLSTGISIFFLLTLIIFILLRNKSKLNDELQVIQIALKESVKETEFANKSKTKFLAHMSHELRTPLNAVLGYSQLLVKDHEISDKNIKILNTINRSGGHLLSLINDVLEISKIEAGELALEPISFDLHVFLADIHSMFEQRIKSNNLTLTLEKAKGLPQFIKADINKLRQIFINVIGNSIKFTPHGGIQIRLSHNDNTKELLIEIEDSGEGISKDEIDKLFLPFKQTLSGKLGGEGAGLGLSIVIEYIEKMGGKIDVRSEIAHGTTFYISIPLEISDMTQYNNSKPREVVSLKNEYKGTNVLIADDNITNNDLLKQTLERVGFKVTDVVNGFEAYRVYKQIKPPIVFLDLEMPLMDGFEAVSQMREEEYSKDTLIIAITASVFTINETKAKDAGFDALINKPFKDYKIFDTIADLTDISFTYSDQVQKEKIIEIPMDLSTLDGDIRNELFQYVSKNKISKTNELLKSIEQQYPSEVKMMQELVDNFDFEKLTSLLKDENV